jgi:hypothetical protein
MRLLFLTFLMVTGNFLYAQLSGSIENNSALYIDDANIKLDPAEATSRFRSNNYLRLDYTFKKFTAGIQAEAYQQRALLNYSPKLKNAGLGTYYLNYKNDSIGLDITAGHFYEEFGSGLALRTWEDRQLGIANSIVGGRVKYSPVNAVSVTALYGRQRNGINFDVTNGSILGLNADAEFSSLFRFKNFTWGAGGSFVNRKNKNDLPGLPSSVYVTSVRSNVIIRKFSASLEYAFKSKDALVEFGNIRPELLFDGDAYLLNLGYAGDGFGINTTFRRLENFSFYSERNLERNVFNEGLLHYVPSLTRHYNYSLNNIYVYPAQANLSFDPGRNKAGEIGGQADLYYTFKKETPLGGKYGTTVSVNYAQWHGLGGRYIAAERKYKADKLGFGNKYYRDASIEIRKKWNLKWTLLLVVQNQYYNARFVEETAGEVNATTVALENIIRLQKTRSLKFQLQHQWAKGGFENWAAAQAEYYFNSKISLFAYDLYNYGNPEQGNRLHYYSAGANYKKNNFRLQVAYGRQRGGLICVGGVCRFVPQSAGLSFSLYKGI